VLKLPSPLAVVVPAGDPSISSRTWLLGVHPWPEAPTWPPGGTDG
jgi:hypothetical protein